MQLSGGYVQLSYLGVKSHKESVGIVLHAGGGPANSKLPGNNGAAALEHRDLRRRQISFILKKPEERRENTSYWRMWRASKCSFVCNDLAIIYKSQTFSAVWKWNREHLCLSYRAHGDGDVKVLGSIVLLEGVDIKPNLTNTQTHTG